MQFFLIGSEFVAWSGFFDWFSHVNLYFLLTFTVFYPLDNNSPLTKEVKKRLIQQEAVFVGELTRLQSQLRAYIISLMPGMSGAADVLQETNIVMWEKRP